MLMQLEFVKGHGTENDFVLIPDYQNKQDLSPRQVRDLCDRRRGLGADGLIRVVRTSAHSQVSTLAAQAPWFMDYRNADGTVAEMCGNGLRVFLAYLSIAGEISPGPQVIATRAGALSVVASAPQSGGIVASQVDLGPWSIPSADPLRGGDCEVQVHGFKGQLPGLSVRVGNPHTVVLLRSSSELAALDLSSAPTVTPTPPEGTNVEFVVLVAGTVAPGTPTAGTVAQAASGQVQMRVYERGVGETRSCGTGAAAVALAARFWSDQAKAPRLDRWQVGVPGGQLVVQANGSLVDGPQVLLEGPAQLVARGVVTAVG